MLFILIARVYIPCAKGLLHESVHFVMFTYANKKSWHHKNGGIFDWLTIRASYFGGEILLGNWDPFENINKHCVANLDSKLAVVAVVFVDVFVVVVVVIAFVFVFAFIVVVVVVKVANQIFKFITLFFQVQ